MIKLPKVFSILVILLLLFSYSISTIYAATLATSDWPMSGGNSAMNKTSSSNKPLPLTVKFRSTISTAGYEFHSAAVPAIGPNAIYLVTFSTPANRHGLIAYDFDGNQLWHTSGLGTDTFFSNPVVSAEGNIYVVRTHGGLAAFNSSGVSLWTSCYAGQNFVGVPVIDNNGRIVLLSGNGGRVYSCNDDGTTNWVYNVAGGAAWHQGSLAISSSGVIYASARTSFRAMNTSDGSVIWSNDSYEATNNVTLLSKDEQTVYQVDDSGTVYAIRASDGATIWSKALGGNAARAMTVGNGNRLYVGSNGDSKLHALDSLTGETVWTFSIPGAGFDWARPIVDANETIHLNEDGVTYSLNSDGTLKSKYNTGVSTTNTNQLSMRSNGDIYFPTGSYFYSLTPWTISLSMDNASPREGDTINFTATSSMLRNDPASTSFNQVQVRMPNGDKLALTYDSTDVNDNSVWKGSYTMPATSSIGPGLHAAVVEAVAYNTTTEQSLNFTDLPSGFNNTGVSASTCFAAHAEGSCTHVVDNNYQTNPDYSLHYNMSVSNAINLLDNSTFVVNSTDNQKALLMINKDSVLFDTLALVNKVTLENLMSGNNPDLIKYPHPGRFNFLPVGDYWDFRTFSAYSGAGFISFTDNLGKRQKIIIQIPYDKARLDQIISQSNGLYSARNLKIIALNKQTNRWVVLPNNVLNTQQQTMATVVEDLSIYSVAIIP